MKLRQSLRIIAVNVLIFVLLLLALELFLRWRINFNPSYYTAIAAKGTCFDYPYGRVCLNSLGYPDDEFDLHSPKPRIGYIGDSVCYGVGVGQGYRIQDLLEQHYPQTEHWSFCNVGTAGAKTVQIQKTLALTDEFRLSEVVYLMNMNDILPDDYGQETGDDAPTRLYDLKQLEKHYLSWLRGQSYLYTYLRNLIKTQATIAGYAAHGYFAYELFPHQSDAIFRQTAARMNYLHQQLAARGVTLQIVILPYEMQASDDAAKRLAQLGIRWEDGFVDGSAQNLLISYLDPDLRVSNPLAAFRPLRPTARAGDYFVHDKGDKLDWNHPTRQGDAIIANYLIAHAIFTPQ